MFGTAELTDDLVARAVAGSEPELSRVVETMGPQVRLMVIARLSATPGQFHAVEELTQLTMIAMARNISQLRAPTVPGLKAYVSGIVVRKVADHLNRRGEGDRAEPAQASLDMAARLSRTGAPLWQFLSAGGRSPGSAAAQADLFALVMSELGRLKDEYRSVITLAFFDQMPTHDIASAMNISRPAASMLLIRAVKALRRNMTGSSRIMSLDDD